MVTCRRRNVMFLYWKQSLHIYKVINKSRLLVHSINTWPYIIAKVIYFIQVLKKQQNRAFCLKSWNSLLCFIIRVQIRHMISLWYSYRTEFFYLSVALDITGIQYKKIRSSSLQFSLLFIKWYSWQTSLINSFGRNRTCKRRNKSKPMHGILLVGLSAFVLLLYLIYQR